MRKRLLIVVSTAFFLLPSAARCAGQADAEIQIRRLHQELIRALLHADVAALDRVLADDYAFTDDDGRFLTKQHILESFRSGDHRMFTFDLSEERLRVYGTTAVMTYRYTCRQTYKDEDVSGTFRITRVFASKNSRWQLVAGHESRIRPAPRH